MRGLVGAVVLAVARVAVADELTGPLVTSAGQHDMHAVPLDALGWAVEATLAIDARDQRATLDITDDRRTIHVEVMTESVGLEGDGFAIPMSGTHVVRVEASGARRLLIVDGQVVIDHDYDMADLVVDAPRGVMLGQSGGQPVHWQRVIADTAPQDLARSALAYQPATHFTGPFATWMMTWAQRERARRTELAAVVLPEAARPCVAFAMVAAVAPAPRPRHLRLAELKKAPPPTAEPMIPEPEIFDFESPRAPPARPVRLRRRNYAIVAQDELRQALAGKGASAHWQSAVDAALSAELPPDASDVLLAQLAALAKHPDACR